MTASLLAPSPAAASGSAAVGSHPLAGRASTERSLAFPAMGGHVELRVACTPRLAGRAASDLRIVASRIRTWARRLTRFSPDSDLSALNRDPAAHLFAVRPTLGQVLEASLEVQDRTEGIVDVSMLEARLAAEAGFETAASPGRWRLLGRRGARSRDRVVARDGRVAFDLDGVAKGWIADRAARLLGAYPATMVDADGDVALRVSRSTPWSVAVADPRRPGAELALLRVPERWAADALGIATSGVTVHRWGDESDRRHHLIDPGSRRPARTNVVQATVVAESALVAEALAKSAVILGSDSGLDLLDRAGALAEVLLLESGEVIATPRSLEWLS